MRSRSAALLSCNSSTTAPIVEQVQRITLAPSSSMTCNVPLMRVLSAEVTSPIAQALLTDHFYLDRALAFCKYIRERATKVEPLEDSVGEFKNLALGALQQGVSIHRHIL